MRIGFFQPEQDIALVVAIRKASGPDLRLVVDANHAYNAQGAGAGILTGGGVCGW